MKVGWKRHITHLCTPSAVIYYHPEDSNWFFVVSHLEFL